MQIKTFLARIAAFFTRKRIIWTGVIVLILLLGWMVFGKKSPNGNIQTAVVTRQDIQKTVLTTGQVVSSTELSLSFQSSGVVRGLNVKEGDKVYAGQVLASLDQSNASAQLESARGTLAQAEANYNKIKAAATAQDIAVSQAAVDAATVTLDNAKQNLINQLQTAYNNISVGVITSTSNLFSNPQSTSPTFSIAGTVQTNSQLVINANNDRAAINSILPDWQNKISTVNDANTDQVVAESIKNINFISNHLNNLINLMVNYTQITSGGSQTTVNGYITSVNTVKTTVDGAGTSITTYTQAVKSAASSLAQAKAALALKQSPARPEDLGIAEAQVISARGQVEVAQTALRNTLVVAPISGTITKVDIKLGELAQATVGVIELLNIDKLHTEAQVSEADIASVQVGQTVDNTFDALGPDQHFSTKVLTINPASTVISGVVNYKVTGSLDNIPGIKPGMTANMTIMVAEKKGVLVVPTSAVVNKENKKVVKVIDDKKKKTYQETEIVVGLEADSGLTEVISGLSEGQEVVTYIK
jgi:HlyD family secretion protein